MTCKVQNAIGISVLVAAAVLAAQDRPPTFRTEANYVRVDAYPTKDGAPVPDLTQDDFEVLENGAVQRIEQFERVVVRAAGPQDSRIEPNNSRDMRAMLESSRARVFVVFLDFYHVEVGGSHNIRKPLIDTLDRLIGADDLVAVMTPEMSATNLAFARKTTTIEGFLTRNWPWGEREQLNAKDPIEDEYRACYPGRDAGPGCESSDGIFAAMIDRRREKRTLDALQDLVRFLRGVREERKAVLVITDGWRLFRPDQTLQRPIRCQPPTGTEVQLDPRTGRLTGSGDATPAMSNRAMCERDRMNLATLQDDREFRDILDEANRANATFYPIDPRGLPVFDTPIMPVNGPAVGTAAPMISPAADTAMLRARLESLHTLAEATDGIAIVNSNDLAGGMRRVVDDLSSYYLLGYYSSGTLDGKFHAITVRVKRAGVQVRARRGYLAATPDSAAAAAATAAAMATPAEADAERAAVTSAIAPLENYTREVPLRVQAAVGWMPGGSSSYVVVEGELSGAREFEYMWRGGAAASIELATADGASLVTKNVTITPARVFRIALAPSRPLAPGDYIVRIGARSTQAALPTRDTMHVTVPPSPQAVGAIWLRRGPATGNRETPTADLRFRRTEQVTVEIPTTSAQAATARLLDRAGKALSVPVTSSLRDDADGSRWTTAQLALAPLAVGEYVIELADGDNRMLAAFRLVP